MQNEEAEIYTPIKLEKEEKNKAKKLIRELTGDNVEELAFYEDEELLDGLKIIYKDKLWDFSLQSQLASIIDTH